MDQIVILFHLLHLGLSDLDHVLATPLPVRRAEVHEQMPGGHPCRGRAIYRLSPDAD